MFLAVTKLVLESKREQQQRNLQEVVDTDLLMDKNTESQNGNERLLSEQNHFQKSPDNFFSESMLGFPP